MNLHRKLKSIVLTYEDGEVVRLMNEEAKQYQRKVKDLTDSHSFRVLAEKDVLAIDLEHDFSYEIIRNKAVTE